MTTCSNAPERPSMQPTRSPRIARGSRSSRTIDRSVGSVDRSARARMTLSGGIPDGAQSEVEDEESGRRDAGEQREGDERTRRRHVSGSARGSYGEAA